MGYKDRQKRLAALTETEQAAHREAEQRRLDARYEHEAKQAREREKMIAKMKAAGIPLSFDDERAMRLDDLGRDAFGYANPKGKARKQELIDKYMPALLLTPQAHHKPPLVQPPRKSAR